MAHFYISVYRLMQEKGIKTNKELSLMSGVSTTRLSDIMTEKNMLTEDKARKIADALDVGIDWLLRTPPRQITSTGEIEQSFR